MAIIVDTTTRLVVQGLTGREGSFHGVRNLRYGTKVVAGVTPGKGGTTHLDRPVFSFERDKRGLYRLFFNDRRGWYCIGTGESAGECLAVWKGKVPRAKAAEQSA